VGNSNHYLNTYSTTVDSEFEYKRLIFNGKIAEILYKGGMNECINTGGGILSLGTGLGKSISCLHILSKLKGKTIIIVNKIPLMKQWESEIKNFLPQATVGIIQGQKNINVEDADIIIAMLQSLARIDYPDSLFQDIKICVVDEAHNICSKVFSQALSKLCSQYTIGLTATPNRSDGCEYIFKWYLGDVVFKSKTERAGLLPILNIIKIDSNEYKEIATVNKTNGQKQIQYTSMLSDLVQMPKRNKLIVELLKDLIKEGRKILVLSDRRNHLTTIKHLFDLDPSISFTIGMFVGQMKISDLEKSKTCDIILATYSAFSEGVSVKELNTLLLQEIENIESETNANANTNTNANNKSLQKSLEEDSVTVQ
jgi:Rad3-related DNA helicase